MKTKILFLLSVIWLLIFLFMGFGLFSSSIKQPQKDRDFKEEYLKPSVVYINGFLNNNSRLPTNEEFDKWQMEYFSLNKEIPINPRIDSLIKTNPQWALRIRYYTSSKSFPKEVIENYGKNDSKYSYVLSTWRGEWDEYYVSWINYYTTDYSHWTRDSFIVLFIFLFIGLLPLTVLIIYKKKKRIA